MQYCHIDTVGTIHLDLSSLKTSNHYCAEEMVMFYDYIDDDKGKLQKEKAKSRVFHHLPQPPCPCLILCIKSLTNVFTFGPKFYLFLRPFPSLCMRCNMHHVGTIHPDLSSQRTPNHFYDAEPLLRCSNGDNDDVEMVVMSIEPQRCKIDIYFDESIYADCLFFNNL